jgi:MYXO-CTERM domain-containing protein
MTHPARSLAAALFVLFAASLAAVAAPRTAEAWCRMTTDPTPMNLPYECNPVGIPLEWRRRCIAIALNEAGARDFTLDDARSIVSSSFGAWLSLTCDDVPMDFDLRMIDELAEVRAAEYNTGSGNVNVIAWVPDWRERDYDGRAFALTTVWHNTGTGEIYDADIEINEQIGTYTSCPSGSGCADGRIDLQNVLTHEAGHFFGIAHSDVMNSTMWWMANAGDVDKRVLRDDDAAAVCTVYPPAAPAPTCDLASGDGELGDFTPRGGLSLVTGGGGGGCCSVGAGAGRRGDHGYVAVLVVALAAIARRRRR